MRGYNVVLLREAEVGEQMSLPMAFKSFESAAEFIGCDGADVYDAITTGAKLDGMSAELMTDEELRACVE